MKQPPLSCTLYSPRSGLVVYLPDPTTASTGHATTDTFDATTVDVSTVKFGPGEATIAHKKAHLEDVDGDGDIDLVMHFRTRDTGISPGDLQACLTGVAGGANIIACDVVTVK